MAARNPSSFDFAYDESSIDARKPIIETAPDTILTNQQYILDTPTLVLSWLCSHIPPIYSYPVISPPAPNTWEWFRRFWVHFDLCGVSATHDVYVSFRFFDASPVVGDNMRLGARFLNVSGGPNTIYMTHQIGSAFTTESEWTDLLGPVAMRSDGEEEIEIGFNFDPDSDGLTQDVTVSLFGFAVFSVER